MKVKQKIVERASRTIDKGTIGFHDYEEIKEEYVTFIDRVTAIMNDLNATIVAYPNKDIAIIQYEE